MIFYIEVLCFVIGCPLLIWCNLLLSTSPRAYCFLKRVTSRWPIVAASKLIIKLCVSLHKNLILKRVASHQSVFNHHRFAPAHYSIAARKAVVPGQCGAGQRTHGLGVQALQALMHRSAHAHTHSASACARSVESTRAVRPPHPVHPISPAGV